MQAPPPSATPSRLRHTVLDLGSDHGQVEALATGDPDGFPLFFFHGWPSGASQGAVYDEAARELGLRIIALNRPGIGRSSPDPGHCPATWPQRVAAAADALEIREFAVLAVSGGGPYALATAHGLPDRVVACTVVSGAPPLHGRTRSKELFWWYRFLIAFRDRFPDLAEAGVGALDPLVRRRPPGWVLAVAGRVMPRRDREAVRSPAAALSFLGFREAMDSGARAVLADGAHYTRPWGFDLTEIRVPVRFWHGTRDHNFGWKLVEDLAARIPGARTHFLRDEGHYSISLLRQRETLEALTRDIALGRSMRQR